MLSYYKVCGEFSNEDVDGIFDVVVRAESIPEACRLVTETIGRNAVIDIAEYIGLDLADVGQEIAEKEAVIKRHCEVRDKATAEPSDVAQKPLGVVLRG